MSARRRAINLDFLREPPLPVVGVIARVLISIFLLSPGSIDASTAQDNRSQTRNLQPAIRYDGLTLEQWRDRIKNLDLKDSASVSAVPGLIAIVQDREAPWVSRRQAAETLGRLGPLGSPGVPVLLRIIDEPSEDETPPRVWGLKAISLYGPVAKPAAPALVAILNDAGRPLIERQLALEALSQIGPVHPAVLPAILDRLASGASSPNHRINGAADPGAAELRELAVESFTLLGPRGAPAIPALLRLFDDRSDVLRMKVAQGLGAMGGRGEIAVPQLAERVVFDESPLVRDAAADALARIGPEAVTTLIQLLEDREEESRWRAATALGTIGRPARQAIEPLKKRLDDESPVVSIRAAEALWKITSDATLVIPTALRTLSESDRQIRIRGARLFAAMGDRARPAIPELRELARDPRSAVRQAAAKVLERLENR